MKRTNDNMRQILDELERALALAISSSSDVSAAVRRIRHEGYSLSLILNCQPQRGTNGGERRPQSEAVFRLDGRDVAFLKSVGIDGTRPAGKRRRNPLL
ncbi:MAG: hypothetical protein D6696_03455 [Acidobacteria bacterium]|nr:MAG: hypothetical protein D6696_03455 [Acidobacteriota bacterium]